MSGLLPLGQAEPLRVVLVDDSALVRRLVGGVLRTEDDLVVAGTLVDGQQAVEQVPELQPDVVVLDVEMPRLDGLETLAALHQSCPGLPVVMYSSLTERGAAVTLEALARGAVDYATKPSATTSREEAEACLRRDLLPLVRLWGRIGRARRVGERVASRGLEVGQPAPPRQVSEPPLATRVRRPARPEVVLVGVSTGGPSALAELLPSLPAGLGVPVLVVQHMPAIFTRLLAERLDRSAPLRVREALDGEPLEPGTVLVAPGGRHLAVERRGGQVVAACLDDPPEHFCRPAVDVLFRTAAAVYGPGVLAVVLTGMGNDGLAGAQAIVRAGGAVLAQDEASSVVWGMPGAVARAGLAEAVLPLAELAPAIAARVVPSPVGATQ
ncbi:chemotaxis response regulator protein-glutamate methylesterase [Aciditerrimonas ferrireducens]|uniref:Protein-glutamate methylesterase/protein-glutamine glutaminase n=1 Tax=Aciditerrimonas ferrireducens TaxID=667306 RepID=A0ABV6C0R9_9ACTN